MATEVEKENVGFLEISKESAMAYARKAVNIKISDDGKKKTIRHELPSVGAFKQYIDQEKTALNLAKDLISGDVCYIPDDETIKLASYEEIIKNGYLFFLASDESGVNRKTGLLSLCPTILTAISLWEAMLDVDEKIKNRLLVIIKYSVDAMLKIVFRDGEHIDSDVNRPIFDASPYEWESFTPGIDGRSYIDSITWALPVFLRLLNLRNKANGEFVFEEYRSRALFLAEWCLEYINNATICKADSADSEMIPAGWNFTRFYGNDYSGKARSLYFTYAASTVYLSFFAEYKSVIDILRIVNDNRGGEQGNLNLSTDYWKDNFKGLRSFVKERAKLENDEATTDDRVGSIIKEVDTLLRKADEGGEKRTGVMVEDFMRFNKGKLFSSVASKDAGPVLKLKWALQQISEEIWTAHSHKLEDKFMYEDFRFQEASSDAIENSGQTNALFTGLLQIGIVLNAAYDVKILEEDKEKIGGVSKAYESMQNTMMIHVQRTQRYLDKLEDKGAAYAVESLILNYKEEITDADGKMLADKLRKNTVRVCSLTPLLLKTTSLLSEYIVRYPQKQMGESLRRIGEKRFFDISKNRRRYYWETDGYHAISNYYYISAIFDFYRYHEEYEQAYIKRYDVMRRDLEIDFDFSESLRAYRKEIEDEKEKLREAHSKEIIALEAQLKEASDLAKANEIGEELRKSIDRVIANSGYFKEEAFIRTVIEGLRTHLARELAARYEKLRPQDSIGNKDKKEKITEHINSLKTPIPVPEDGLLYLLKALAADIILPSAIDDKLKNEEITFKLIAGAAHGSHFVEHAVDGGESLIQKGNIDIVFRKMLQAQELDW